LPYDLSLTQNHEIKEHSKSQNNMHTDGRSQEWQALEHLWLDRGQISEEEDIRDPETEEEGRVECCYGGDRQRRYSYQAAIDNQTCLPGEQRYPRCRSGSFQAAIEGSQKDSDQGLVSQNWTQAAIKGGQRDSEKGQVSENWTTAAIEGGQRDSEKGKVSENWTRVDVESQGDIDQVLVSENWTQAVSSRTMLSGNVSSYHSTVPSRYNHLDDCLSSTKTSGSHGASSYSQNPSHVCYSVCDSGHTVGCGGDFTVNSSYLTCTDTSHNHCDVMIKQFTSCHDEVTRTPQGDDRSRLYGTEWRDKAQDSGCTTEDTSPKHRYR
jgi:predicted transcriptional regulator